MRPAVPEASNARAARVLLVVWVAIVLGCWFGLFVASMDPDAPRRIAIDLDGYFLPRYVWASEMLRRGVVPLWNPYELAGVPMLGVGQGAVLYPPRVLLFAVLPPALAMHAFFVVHYVLLGAGSFAAMRALGLAWPGAAVGALIVAFQPFMLHGHYAPHWISNFVWTPIAIAALVRLVERPGPARVLVLAAALTLQVYAGYPEYAFDSVVVLAVLFPFIAVGAARKGGWATIGLAVRWLAVAAVVTTLATAMQWVALLETVRESVRAAGEFQFMFGQVFDRGEFAAGLRGWVDALGLLFYVPPLGWVLLAVGLISRTTPHRAAMLVLAALAWAGPTWLRDVPPFSLFRGPLCWHSMLHLPLGMLAGAGLDRLVSTEMSPRTSGRSTTAWVVAGLVCIAILPVISMRAIVWTAIGLAGVGLAARRGRVPAGVAVVLACVLGTIGTWVPGARSSLVHRWAGGEPTFPSVEAVRRAGEAIRMACDGFAAGRIVAPRETWLGVPLLAELSTAQGYPESLAPRRTSRLLEVAGLAPHSVFPLDRTRLEAAGPLLRLLDVRCLVLPSDWAPVAAALGFRPAGTLADGRIVRVRSGQPAVLVGVVESVSSDEITFARVSAPGFDPAARALVTGRGESLAVEDGGGRVTEVARPAPGRIVVRVDAPAGGYLVVPETWYPGWRAAVDGVPVPVERADYAFLGVSIPAGARAVSFRYAPRGFGWATWATVVGVILLVGPMLAAGRRGAMR